MFNAKILNSSCPYLFGNEIDYLHDLGKKLTNESIVVVLGVGPALMIMSLLEESTKFYYVYAIDIASVDSAKKHLEAIGKLDRVTFINGDSSLEASSWEDDMIDLLLVDADHTYDGVMKDINAWWPKVRYNGTVLFHDYEKVDPTSQVKEAVENSITKEWKEVDRPGISIVFRKIKNV